MPRQAQSLIDKLKTDSHVRWADDWKVITVFVGGNDLCAYCNDQVSTRSREKQLTWILLLIIIIIANFSKYQHTI